MHIAITNKKIINGLKLGVLATLLSLAGYFLKNIAVSSELAFLINFYKVFTVISFIFFIPLLPAFLIVFYFAPPPSLFVNLLNIFITFSVYFFIGYFVQRIKDKKIISSMNKT